MTELTSHLKKCVENDIVTSKAAVLVYLFHCADHSSQIGHIAHALGMPTSRVSMVGASLEADHLVMRCVPVSDLRKVSMALSPSGADIAKTHVDCLAGVAPALRVH